MYTSIKIITVVILIVWVKNTAYGKPKLKFLEPKNHELTIYVIPSMYELDWDSPAALYKTVKSCYAKTMHYKTNYLTGHTIVEVNSPKLEKPLLVAQMSSSMKEKRQMIFKEKAGYAIIGAILQGKMETEEEIIHALRVYAKRKKLAFVKYSISDEAFERVIDFISHYSGNQNPDYTPYINYGGAFWPRFKEEGSGCSAFGMTILELVNLLPEEHTKAWQLNNKIPIELIGGKYNNGHKVTIADIKNATTWYEGDGQINVDYVLYSVYNPSIIYNWILEVRNKKSHKYQAVEWNGIPGVHIHAEEIEFDRNEPLFLDRDQPNLFIDIHKQAQTQEKEYVSKR